MIIRKNNPCRVINAIFKNLANNIPIIIPMIMKEYKICRQSEQVLENIKYIFSNNLM